jgi:hypothetical protein
MATNVNKVFSSYQPCQFVKNYQCSMLSKHFTLPTSSPIGSHSEMNMVSWEVYMWDGLDAQSHLYPDDGE